MADNPATLLIRDVEMQDSAPDMAGFLLAEMRD